MGCVDRCACQGQCAGVYLILVLPGVRLLSDGS